MPYSLPSLDYSVDALEPHIDARTMEIHHGKHHQTYIDKLNDALSAHADLDNQPIEDLVRDLSSLPEQIRGAVRNNGGGHYNHTFFWKSISASGGGIPTGNLAEAINSSFGNFDSFKAEFLQAALTRFRFGLGMVGQTNRRIACSDLNAQSGQPAHGRGCRLGRITYHRVGCLGACLLLKLSKQKTRLCIRILEYCRLGPCRFSLFLAFNHNLIRS